MTETRTVAAFDFDGTITYRDTMAGFLRRAVGTRLLLAASGFDLPRLALAASGHGSRNEGKERLLMRLFAGRDPEPVLSLGREYGAYLATHAIRSEMRARIAWHHARGHEVVIVSASLDTYLEEVARILGIDALICTRLEIGDDGRYTGRMVEGNCRGPEKARRLTGYLGAGPGDEARIAWAYGDSGGDRELLPMAEHPIWVSKRAGRFSLPPT